MRALHYIYWTQTNKFTLLLFIIVLLGIGVLVRLPDPALLIIIIHFNLHIPWAKETAFYFTFPISKKTFITQYFQQQWLWIGITILVIMLFWLMPMPITLASSFAMLSFTCYARMIDAYLTCKQENTFGNRFLHIFPFIVVCTIASFSLYIAVAVLISSILLSLFLYQKALRVFLAHPYLHVRDARP
ncbi:hypothetical protein GCM10007425_15820 [Lysinibacillus alkalisoli]|uniref:Uncharacterized protein n=1 Tax=Lysinibacillus alkalisoli TaxID=1911548 RepID=A0A917G4S3_9BACI|nr:hypothetical protein [Lysinibacillus alkalisoli]GGG22196.1 hypothetical protein GCM10007425_15820 [Lysinibacillus alkalisoli]